MGITLSIVALALLGQPSEKGAHAVPMTVDGAEPVPTRSVMSPGGVVLVVSDGPGGGVAHAAPRGRAWTHGLTDAQPLGGAALRVFGRELFMVDTEADVIRVLDARGTERRRVALPPGARPADIFVDDDGSWLVTSKSFGQLLRVDPGTGTVAVAADMSGIADADGNPDLARMERAGGRLFIQVQRLIDGIEYTPHPHGALAVFDLASRTLVDCDPVSPGVQALELQGPSPRFRMHVSEDGGRLLVSATSPNHQNLSGGIERVDTSALRSDGFVVAEADLFAIGAFVMLNDDRGVLLFHTDIVPSNHTLGFGVEEGADFGIGAVTDLWLYVDALGFDPETGLLYVGGAFGALYIVDTRRDEVVDLLTLDRSKNAVDIAIVR